MSRFLQASKAEFLKVLTTKIWWILALIMFLYVGFTAAMMGGIFKFGAEMSGADLSSSTQGLASSIYGIALSVGFVFPLLLGALSVTTEYRHHTIIPTFLTVARRPTALAAKLWVQFVFGILFGIIAFAASILASVFFLASAGMDTALADPQTWLIILRSILAMSLWAMIGVGIGSLIPNQAAVLIVVIAFTQFIEPILRVAAMFNETTGKIGQFLPGAVSDALAGSSFYSMMSGGDMMSSNSLSWWLAALVMLGYVALTSLLGYWLRWSRDVN